MKKHAPADKGDTVETMKGQHKGPTAVGILGAGAQAGETARYLEDIIGLPVSFYADDYGTDHKEVRGKSHLNVSSLVLEEGTRLVSALGDSILRKKMVSLFREEDFTNCICVPFNDSNECGVDVTIAPGCVLTEDIKIGSHVLINIGCTVNHDVAIGDYCTISPGVNIGGHTRIGQEVFIGIGASLVDRITIGDGAVIAAGAVVTKDVRPNETVAGVPAKMIHGKDDKPRPI